MPLGNHYPAMGAAAPLASPLLSTGEHMQAPWLLPPSHNISMERASHFSHLHRTAFPRFFLSSLHLSRLSSSSLPTSTCLSLSICLSLSVSRVRALFTQSLGRDGRILAGPWPSGSVYGRKGGPHPHHPFRPATRYKSKRSLQRQRKTGGRGLLWVPPTPALWGLQKTGTWRRTWEERTCPKGRVGGQGRPRPCRPVDPGLPTPTLQPLQPQGTSGTQTGEIRASSSHAT